jgi:hypothetical protein
VTLRMNGLVGEQLERSFGSSAGGMTPAKTRFLTSPKRHFRRLERVQQNPFSVILNSRQWHLCQEDIAQLFGAVRE